jgi:signal transduction histidine kinase
VLDQARLFEAFHRASNTGEIGGTGLGLSIVKSYVEIHGGRIEFQSHEGEGTIFIVHIPFKEAL